MRPKRVILLVSDSEQELSTLKFLLDTNSYRVISTMDLLEAMNLFAETRADLVIADFEIARPGNAQLIMGMKQLDVSVPVLLLGEHAKVSEASLQADAFLSKKGTPMSEVLERIKCMASRKRGPRKGKHRRQSSASDNPVASECLVASS